MEFADNLNRLADSLLTAGASAFNRGIERETLRTSMDGALAATPHPKAFGSKLTHPLITTDFSEAQLELITGVHDSVQGLVAELALIHRAVCQGLGDGDNDELLWAASMPCLLDSAAPIPLAHYGKSNLGRLKTTYRSGLGLRYGRAMQTVCAVHYNFSLSDKLWTALQAQEGDPAPAKDYRSRRYFDLMRNFHRYSWLLVYLFGASPAVCNSFLRDREHELLPFDDSTAYLPHATSLRSSNLGYRSDTQSAEMNPCYNSLDTYVNGLASAICKPYPPYARLGEQVNANVL
ncbi:MAG: glutamate--cysteine ligase, partial [Pseudomonadales bacterium]